MTQHIVMWKFKEELSAEEKVTQAGLIKEGLESLQGVIPGLLSIRVQAAPLASSNADLMLFSTFESETALNGYSKHPAHVAVANERVRPFMQNRLCLDFEDQ